MNDILNEINQAFDEAIENADQRTLGEKLQDLRKAKGLKLVDIARITGLSESLVGKIEGDKLDDIKISTMKKLCIAYDVSPDLFIMHMGNDDEVSQIKTKSKDVHRARAVLKA